MAKKPSTNPEEKPSESSPPKGQDGRMLRAPAEVLYAEEIEALTKADRHDRPPGWKMSPRAVLSLYLRRQVRLAGDHAQVHRQPAAGRNRDLDARYRSRLALTRRTRDGQVVALGAPHRRDQWRLDQGRARNGRNHRGADSLYLELCIADRPRAKSWGADQESRSFARWSRAASPDSKK